VFNDRVLSVENNVILATYRQSFSLSSIGEVKMCGSKEAPFLKKRGGVFS
jgi:hypothetical protein